MNILELLSVSSEVPQEIEYNKGGTRQWDHEVDYEVLGKLIGVKVKRINGNLYFNGRKVVHVKCCQRTIDFTTLSSCDPELLSYLAEEITGDSTYSDTDKLRCRSDGFVWESYDYNSRSPVRQVVLIDTDKYKSIKSTVNQYLNIDYKDVMTGNTSGTAPGQMHKVHRFSITGSGLTRFEHKIKFIDMRV